MVPGFYEEPQLQGRAGSEVGVHPGGRGSRVLWEEIWWEVRGPQPRRV